MLLIICLVPRPPYLATVDLFHGPLLLMFISDRSPKWIDCEGRSKKKLSRGQASLLCLAGGWGSGGDSGCEIPTSCSLYSLFPHLPCLPSLWFCLLQNITQYCNFGGNLSRFLLPQHDDALSQLPPPSLLVPAPLVLGSHPPIPYHAVTFWWSG